MCLERGALTGAAVAYGQVKRCRIHSQYGAIGDRSEGYFREFNPRHMFFLVLIPQTVFTL